MKNQESNKQFLDSINNNIYNSVKKKIILLQKSVKKNK